mmetsp:Transcript_41181/g.76558  ORF Transcript_41181/g.76558 Transcript_41181/m.76558 type:complete len:118 (-) Transcript_41181:152-505(-)
MSGSLAGLPANAAGAKAKVRPTGLLGGPCHKAMRGTCTGETKTAWPGDVDLCGDPELIIGCWKATAGLRDASAPRRSRWAGDGVLQTPRGLTTTAGATRLVAIGGVLGLNRAPMSCL